MSKLREKFCKDLGLSIKIFKSPYFEDRLKMFGLEEEYSAYENLANSFDNEELFFAEYNKLKQAVIDAVKEQESFKKLQELKNVSYDAYDITRSKKGIYRKDLLGKKMLSFDLVSANFSALKYFSEQEFGNLELVLNSNTYKEMVSKFTDIEFFINSKYIRQVIFGQIGCKSFGKVEKHITGKFIPVALEALNKIDDIQKTDKDDNLSLLTYMDDEIVFDVDGYTDEEIQEVIDKVLSFAKELNVNLHYAVFTMKTFERQLENASDNTVEKQQTSYFLKIVEKSDEEDKYIIKGVDALHYPYALIALNDYRKSIGEDVEDIYVKNEDVFVSEKLLVKLLQKMTLKVVD